MSGKSKSDKTSKAATGKAATSKAATSKAATRKGPADSATLHPVGTVLPGSDGRTHRWSPAAAGGDADGGCAPCAFAAVALLGSGRGGGLGPRAPRSRRARPRRRARPGLTWARKRRGSTAACGS